MRLKFCLLSGALVFGAGVSRLTDGALATAGGRVLTIVGRDASVEAAAEAAYEAAALIQYEGKSHRSDIGRPHTAVAA